MSEVDRKAEFDISPLESLKSVKLYNLISFWLSADDIEASFVSIKAYTMFIICWDHI